MSERGRVIQNVVRFPLTSMPYRPRLVADWAILLHSSDHL